jgi:hypothetical protein
MRFAYWTIDEVNQHRAERLAERAGVELDIRTFRDAAPSEPFDAVLYDLDFFPADCRRALLADLQAQQRIQPVAVHSYHLPARQARTLRRQGVIVVRRLRFVVFARLRKTIIASRRARSRNPQHGASAASPR